MLCWLHSIASSILTLLRQDQQHNIITTRVRRARHSSSSVACFVAVSSLISSGLPTTAKKPSIFSIRHVARSSNNNNSRRFSTGSSTTLSFISRSVSLNNSRSQQNSNNSDNNSDNNEQQTTRYNNIMMSMSSKKLDSPSAQRNKEPIWNILSKNVISSLLWSGEEESVIDKGKSGTKQRLQVLEIAAGCGVHTDYFASKLAKQSSSFIWYPTDPDPVSLESIQTYIDDTMSLSNNDDSTTISSPLPLTLTKNGIKEEGTTKLLLSNKKDLIICINMIHISPWDATLGLMKLAGENLNQSGMLYLYGPYKVKGEETVQSNLNFDHSLKSRNAQWGLRNLEDVIDAAEQNGLQLIETIQMPSNNLSVVFQKK